MGCAAVSGPKYPTAEGVKAASLGQTNEATFKGQPRDKCLSHCWRVSGLVVREGPTLGAGGGCLPVPRLGDKPAAGLHLHVQAPLHAAHLHVLVQVPVHVVLGRGQLQLWWGLGAGPPGQ